MSYDDEPDVVIFGDRRQRARKEHRCDTCLLGGPLSSIPVGQEYRRITGTQDGEFFIIRECVGGCPRAVMCPACGGSGLINDEEPFGDGCRTCWGVGKVREESQAS